MSSGTPPFPEFGNGQVFTRPDDFNLEVGVNANVKDEYTAHAYQFGTSTNPDMCQPAKIIYAESEEDVMKAVKYAYDAKIAVALRSSGHHYQAYSSTNGENIQLDVSRMKKITQEAPGSTHWTVQAGCQLQDFDAALRKQGMFIPHGECSTVAVGGHIQTGGFSPSFSRSFGLFVDHATEFTIIMAPKATGEPPIKKIVTKPNEGEESTDNAELWYTILGGSPGNFGVIIEVKLIARKDEDHKHSRGVWYAFTYETPNRGREVFQRLMEIACEYSDDENLPADYCFNVFMIHGNTFESQDLTMHKSIDTLMCHEHPDIYGPRAPGTPPWLGMSLVWCNVEGDKCTFEDTDENGYCAKNFFDEVGEKIKELRKGKKFDFEEAVRNLWKEARTGFREFAEFLTHISDFTKLAGFLFLDGKQDLRMSDMMSKLSFPARISATPCLGATLLGFSNNLSKDDHSFSRWTAKVEDQGHWTKGLMPDCQWTFFGGKYNQMRPENCGNYNVLAHRTTTICFLDYFHYDNVVENEDVEAPKDITLAHVDEVVEGLAGPNGDSGFFGCDRRWMAFCNEDVSLDELWEKYFNKKSDYLRVLKMKRVVDPTDVFTPNLYCVGASRKYKEAEEGSPALMTIHEISTAIEGSGGARLPTSKKRKLG